MIDNNKVSKTDKNFKCPLCELETKQIYKESHVDNNINYDLFECSSCKVQHWSPLKNPGGDWYERDERYANRNIDPTVVPGLQHKLSMKTIRKFPGTIFDVGCGNGNFLAYAKGFGLTGVGIDFDRDGIESGKRTFGLAELYVDDLKGFVSKNPNRKFDWVTFFDVFEHIDNHNDFINDIKLTMKDGGRIAFSIPNRNGSRWILTSDWPPRHLTRWDKPSITKYLESRGFSNVIVQKIPAPYFQFVLKMKWKYGKIFNFGLVSKIKQKEAKETYTNEQGKVSYIPKKSMKVKIIHTLAKIKDFTIFGIPAFILFYIFGLSDKINCDLLIIAEKK